MSAPDVFISYAHDDAATARLVADALGADLHIRAVTPCRQDQQNG